MRVSRSILSAFIVAITISQPGAAASTVRFPGQLSDPEGHQNLNATDIRASEPVGAIRIDGVVDPEEWAGAPVISDFTARNPIEGAEPSQRTEVRILYTRSHLYVAFSCFDVDPDGIVVRVSTRDNYRIQSDKVGFDIDPYHDHRKSYYFQVSVANNQTDYLGIDVNWDGVWDSATRITDEGWFAEFAIPFAILRFESLEFQTFGVNFHRSIQRTREELAWRAWHRDELLRVDKFGHLENLRGLRSSHNLEIMPYAKTSGQRYYSSTAGPVAYINENFSDFGLDLKYGLTSNLALDVALNPDFGQIAPDAEQINVTRYERHFRELRPFFQEGQTILRTPLQIFYSRRIGKQVSGGPEVNMLAGAKITGRTGPYQIGIIDAVTEHKDYSYTYDGTTYDATVPMANYSVVRIQRDILTRSNIGILAVGKDSDHGDGAAPYQRAFGADFSFNMDSYHYISGMLARSVNPGEKGNDWAGQFRAGLRSDLWDYGVDFNYLGPQFDVRQVGYITQVDRRRVGWNFGWKPRPERNGIRRIEMKTSGQSSHNFAGLYTTGRFGVEFKIQGMNYMELDARATLNDTRWLDVDAAEPWNTSDEIRPYRGMEYNLSFKTDASLDYSFSASTTWGNFLDYGDYYFGHDWSVRSSFNFRPSSRFGGSVSLTRISEYFDDGTLDETKNLLVTRLSYYFTSNLSVKLYNQFLFSTNSDSEVKNRAANTLNLVFAYFLNAKSILYVIYNEIRDDGIDDWQYYDEFGRLPLSDRAFLVKFTYWFSL